MTESTTPPASSGSAANQPPGTRKQSTGPTGTPRSGRRQTQRRRPEPETRLQRYRTLIIAVVVVAVVVGVSAFVFTSASSATYACGSIDTVQTPAQGEVGQIQPDQGHLHVNTGDKITYPVCPPASGKHINRSGFGPLKPNVYGPDDSSAPNGWVHNLEHGGLVLLYSCDKGACDAASLDALKAFSAGFPNSAICDLPAGVVGPVVARFEQMPTRYAALVWDRAFYLDALDPQAIYDFYLKYGEKVTSDGSWITPPEPQCNPPSPSPAASESAPAVSPSAPAVSPSAPAASPSAPAVSPAASPSAEASPSPAAS